MNEAKHEPHGDELDSEAYANSGGDAGAASQGGDGDSNDAAGLKKRLAESEDKLLRMAAEFDNSRKRLQSRSEELVKYGNEKIVLEVLAVVDNLDRAITSLDQGHDPKSVLKGLHLVQNALHKILEANGVQPIESVGQIFDPNLHEAVGQADKPGAEEDQVIEEVQKGYTLHGRLARPSRVKIAKKH